MTNPYHVLLVEFGVIIAGIVAFYIVGNKMIGPMEPLE